MVSNKVYEHRDVFEKTLTFGEFFSYSFGQREWAGPFECETCPGLQFYLKIFPQGEEYEDYTAFFLYCKTEDDLEINYCLSVTNFDGVVSNSSYTAKFSNDHRAWGRKKMTKIPVGKYIPDDAEITFKCTVNFDLPVNLRVPGEKEQIRNKLEKLRINKKPSKIGNSVDYHTVKSIDNSVIQDDLVQPYDLYYTLEERISEMFQENINYDIILNTSDKEQRQTHKFILSSRSPVLHEIIKKEEKNTETDKVEIDVSYPKDVVDVAVDFLYTDKLPNQTDASHLFELFKFSDTYQINDLKYYTLDKLEYELSTENAVLISNFALEINNQRLRYLSNNFIKEYLTDIKQTSTGIELLSLENCKYILKMM